MATKLESNPVKAILESAFTNQNPIAGFLSEALDSAGFKRVNIRPAVVKGRRVHQFEYLRDAQAIHRNLSEAEAREELRNLLPRFRRTVLRTAESDFEVTVKPSGSMKVKRTPPSARPVVDSHDREKRRILPEGEPNPFLAKLGVMTADGRVIAAKRDKFRQINRYLEMVADVAEHLPKDRTVNVVDFGCGKSFLTFALYHFLHVVRGLDVNIVGLDLKQDVIAHCNTISHGLNYAGLRFEAGDIATFNLETLASQTHTPTHPSVDMVVSLHACDTATDDALAKAVDWNAKVILSVPCCQHELNKQLRNPLMKPMLKHGIIRERLTEIVTDSARAALLELCGYSVQLMEFIATEHTPKNLLIRAVKQAKAGDPSKLEEYRALADFWGIHPALERALQRHLKFGGSQ